MARQANRQKVAEWQQRLQRFEKAGLTVARFCARERVAVPTFWYWRRKSAGQTPVSRTTPFVFSPVEVVGGRAISLRFPIGAVLEIPEDRPDLVRIAIEAAAGVSPPC